MSSVRLTETSYIVIGLLEACEPATPYDLKQLARQSTMHFWYVPHTQIYTECGRLADAGLLSETREQEGRRRRVYRLTDAGRDALERWRHDPEARPAELRSPATLKLFFGADPAALAAGQLEQHRAQLAEYEGVLAELEVAAGPPGWRRALTLGIGNEQAFIRFWSELDGSGDG